jgi:hypothetical protein
MNVTSSPPAASLPPKYPPTPPLPRIAIRIADIVRQEPRRTNPPEQAGRPIGKERGQARAGFERNVRMARRLRFAAC